MASGSVTRWWSNLLPRPTRQVLHRLGETAPSTNAVTSRQKPCGSSPADCHIAEGRARLQRSSRLARASTVVAISCGGGGELGTVTAFNSTRLRMVISLLDLASQGL